MNKTNTVAYLYKGMTALFLFLFYQSAVKKIK